MLWQEEDASKQSRPCMGGKQPLSDICVLYKCFFRHLRPCASNFLIICNTICCECGTLEMYFYGRLCVRKQEDKPRYKRLQIDSQLTLVLAELMVQGYTSFWFIRVFPYMCWGQSDPAAKRATLGINVEWTGKTLFHWVPVP